MFDKMSGRIGTVYRSMWGDGSGINEDKIEKVTSRSYRISFEDDKKLEAIEDYYGIKDHDSFSKGYDQATNGDGNEKEKILTLHSSSRLALLVFYGLCPGKKEITLTLDEKEVIFDFSVFEFKNPVINQPSNMDIVLKGKRKEDGKQVLLFLESKFAEYYLYASEKSTPISRRYESADFS